MEIDSVKKMYLIHVKEHVDLFKFDIYPSRDIQKRMCVGTLALGKDEAMRVYDFLRCYFEGAPLPSHVAQITLAGKPRRQVSPEFRPPNTGDLQDAETLQRENDEGSAEPSPKDPKKSPVIPFKFEGLTMEESNQV